MTVLNGAATGEHAVSRQPGEVMSVGGCVQGLWMNCAICPDGGAMPGDMPGDPGGHAPVTSLNAIDFDGQREDPEGIEPMPAPDSYPHVTCGCAVGGQRAGRRRAVGGFVHRMLQTAFSDAIKLSPPCR